MSKFDRTSADGDVAGSHRRRLHAALFGQVAMEQTFIVPVEALVAPEHVPIRVLEKICRKKVA
jgi:hypothetical protein